MESMDVASGCGCKEVYRFPYPYSSCICSFLQQPYFLFFFLMFFVFVIIILEIHVTPITTHIYNLYYYGILDIYFIYKYIGNI